MLISQVKCSCGGDGFLWEVDTVKKSKIPFIKDTKVKKFYIQCNECGKKSVIDSNVYIVSSAWADMVDKSEQLSEEEVLERLNIAKANLEEICLRNQDSVYVSKLEVLIDSLNTMLKG